MLETNNIVKRILPKATTFLLFLLLGTQTFAQLSYEDIDQRLIDVYGETRVKEMLINQYEFVDYMNFYVQNAYEILTDVPERKLPYFEDISTLINTRTGESITEDDIDNLNILFLSITRKNNEYLTYKLGDTGTVVVFISPENVLERYNFYKQAGGAK